MDRAQVYTVDTGLPRDDNQAEDQPGEILKAFRSFVLEFRLDNSFIYRYALNRNLRDREIVLATARCLFTSLLTALQRCSAVKHPR